MGRLRDADRRVAARAWTPVRRPSLPAWGWFVIDVAAGSLLVTVISELGALVSGSLGQIVGALGFPAVIAVAVSNFVRSTRGVPEDGTIPDANGRREEPDQAP